MNLMFDKTLLVAMFALSANPVLSAEEDISRNLAEGYNFGVRCDASNTTCTGVTYIESPDNDEETRWPNGWRYEYQFVQGLPNGFGNYPGNNSTDEQRRAIVAASNGLIVYVRLFFDEGRKRCIIFSDYRDVCDYCTWDGCEGYGSPCVGNGCGSYPLEGPLAVRYDCTNVKFGDTYGKRFGLNYEVKDNVEKWSSNEEGCANLNPFLYPPGDKTPGDTKGDKSAKKGKKEKVGKKDKKSKKGKADKKR